MRISILTLGTRGNIQPCIGLGKKLVEAGHRVQIATFPNYEAFIKGYGLDFLAVGGDVNKYIREFARGQNPMTMMKASKTYFAPMVDEIMDTILLGTQDVDIYIYNPLGNFAHHIAEKRGVRCIRVAHFPLESTRTVPHFAMPQLPLGGGYNAWSYRFINQALQLLGTRSEINRWRKKQGMHEHSLFEYPYNTLHDKPVPALFAYSEHLVPRPVDWGAHLHVTGFWWLDAQSHWQPPTELLHFLDKGDVPVYVGFGGLSGNHNYQYLIRTAVDALRQCGQRAILVRGEGEVKGLELPSTVFAISDVPHDWLFPRVKAVIHHGGAGTTAAGLRAGCPTIICPYFLDQPFWGGRVAALGVGSKPIPQQSITSDKLAAAIHFVTTDPSIRKNASLMGEKLRAEDGGKQAVAVLESLT